MQEHAATIEKATKLIMFGGLAGFGGAVKYVAATIRSAEKVSQRRFFSLLAANIFISSFCGLMGGLIASTMTDDVTTAFIASGLIGYLGTQGLDIIILSARKKLEPASVMPIPPSEK